MKTSARRPLLRAEVSILLRENTFSGRFRSTSLVTAGLASAAIGCAETEPIDAVLGATTAGSTMTDIAATSDPCEAELAGSCGAACVDDGTCPAGQYCQGNGTCGADCTPAGGQCVGTCTAAGRCDETAPIATGPVETDDDPLLVDVDPPSEPVDPMEQCIEVVSGFEKTIPTVLIVVDRSGSMARNFEGGRDRWDTVRDTLANPANGLIQSLQDSVRFGLSLYTSVNPPGGDSTDFDECPTLVEAPIGLGNFDQLSMIYNQTELLSTPGGGTPGHTPTGESVQAATATLLAFSEPGPKAIVLATDGDPDNCMDGDANATPVSFGLSEDAVKDAFSQGIKTYVISVGDDTTESHLKTLAELGQGDPLATPYSALTSDDLELAFRDIIGGERSCSFPLQGESIPEFHVPNGVVTLGAQTLVHDDPNGWALVTDPATGGQSVVLQGAACETARSTSDDVNISFPCILESQIPR